MVLMAIPTCPKAGLIHGPRRYEWPTISKFLTREYFFKLSRSLSWNMSAPPGGTSSTCDDSHSSCCAQPFVQLAAAATNAKARTFRWFILKCLSRERGDSRLIAKRCCEVLDNPPMRAQFKPWHRSC